MSDAAIRIPVGLRGGGSAHLDVGVQRGEANVQAADDHPLSDVVAAVRAEKDQTLRGATNPPCEHSR